MHTFVLGDRGNLLVHPGRDSPPLAFQQSRDPELLESAARIVLLGGSADDAQPRLFAFLHLEQSLVSLSTERR